MSLGWIDGILLSARAVPSRAAGLFDLSGVGEFVDTAARGASFAAFPFIDAPMPAAPPPPAPRVLPVAAAAGASLYVLPSPSSVPALAAAGLAGPVASAGRTSTVPSLPSLADFTKALDVAGSRAAELIRADADASVARENARTARLVNDQAVRSRTVGGPMFDLSGLLSAALPVVVVVGVGAVLLRLIGGRR